MGLIRHHFFFFSCEPRSDIMIVFISLDHELFSFFCFKSFLFEIPLKSVQFPSLTSVKGY